MMENPTPDLKIDYPKHDNIAAIGDDDKSPLLAKEEPTHAEKQSYIPIKYKITVDELVEFVQEGEKRTFSEEIDKLEAYGGLSFFLFNSFSILCFFRKFL